MAIRALAIQALADEEMLTGEFLRGDPITGDRYYSREFMQKEWDQMWTRVWQIGGMAAQLSEPGSVITHAIGQESILMMRDEQGVIRAYYNVCPHRGNRLVNEEEKCGVKRLVCAYHGWTFSLDGKLKHVRDADDFPKGNPIGKVELTEIKCETFAGLVWFNMNPDACTLRDYLGVVADKLAVYDTDDWVRVMHLTAEVECNWKIIHDNFNEAYHVPTLHRELATHIDDDHQNTVFEMYRSGHSLMEMKGSLPSGRLRAETVLPPLDSIMEAWDLPPDGFKGRVREVRAALQLQKRELGRERGLVHYDKLSDDQLTDYHHFTLFPNISLTMSADGYQVLRPQPHATDPEKCLFDHWFMVPKLAGIEEAATPLGMRPLAPAAHEVFLHGETSIGFVADQDLSVAVKQQRGLHSRGYTDAYLSNQESRVRRLHEVINDYIEGRRS